MQNLIYLTATPSVMAHVGFLAEISKKFPQVEYQSNALRLRSPSTHSHSLGVVQAAFYVGHALKYKEYEMVLLGIAGLLHDLGKTNLEGKVIEGPQQLNEVEWAEMTKHPILGHKYIMSPYTSEVPDIVRLPTSIQKLEHRIAIDVADVILGHHEHGRDRYPLDPYAEDFSPVERRHVTPLLCQMSQIICACDILDALVTHRNYKPKMDYEPALKALRQDFRGEIRIVNAIEKSIGIAHLYCHVK